MDFSKMQIGFGAIAIVLLIGYMSVSLFGSPLAIVGSSDITFDSNSEFWDGEAIVVDWVEDDSTENIQIASEDITQGELETATGQDISGDITIEAEYTEVTANYDYNDGSEVKDPRNYNIGENLPVVSYDYYTTGDQSTVDVPSECQYLPGGPYTPESSDGGTPGDADGTTPYFYDSYDGLLTERACLTNSGFNGGLNFYGNVYDLGSPDITVTTEFTISVGDDYTTTETITTGPDGQQSTFLTVGGERVGHIEWVGNLGDGNTFASPSDSDTMVYESDSLDTKWFIRQSNYESYRDYMFGSNSGLISDLQQYTDSDNQGGDEFETKLEEDIIGTGVGGSERVGTVLEEHSGSEIWSGSDGFYNGGYASTNGGVYPQYRVTLKADDIIVGITVGEPSINEQLVSPPTNLNDQGQVVVSEGRASTVAYEVENVGGEAGAFVGEIQCNGDFSTKNPSIQNTVEPGQSEVFQQEVTFGSTSEQVESCEIQVYDEADPTIIDTKSFDVYGDPSTTCFPDGGYNPDGSDIVSCDGTSTEVVQTCESGEAGFREFDSYEEDGDQYVFTVENEDGSTDTFRLDKDTSYVNDGTVSGSWSNTVIACGLGDTGGDTWLDKLAASLGLPSPGGNSGYAEECQTGLGFINPVCSIGQGIEGFVNATDEAMALFDVGFGFLVSLVTGGILYVPYRKYVTESSEPAIQATGAIAVLGFSVLLGFLAFQWIQGLIPKLVIVSLLLSYVVIRSIIPGL